MLSPNETHPTALKCPQCGADLIPHIDAFIICQYCGSSLVWKGAGQATPESHPTAIRGMRLKQFVYTDTQGTGLEMFRMLAPAGWQFQGGCRWLLDNPGMPAVINIQLGNPQGAEAFEILPNINFTWNNNPMTRMMFPVGSRYFGAEVRPPMKVLDAFHQILLPRYRSSARDLQILNEELQPDLPRLVKSEAAVSGGWAEGAKMRISYSGQSGALEEEIYGVVEVFRAPLASAFGVSEVIFWWLDYLFSFRTAAGRLDATADLFSVMIKSFQLNPHWYAAYKSIIQSLAQAQIQRIHHIGQIGEIYARTGREMREQNLNDWYNRQATYDRLATDRSRAIRDVDAFFDPNREEVVELPAGYGHAWANNLGEYIVTDDANFNPNLESNQHWEPMEQK
jgi:DNA-directed RNA polymerase subunit RPC12/RpoP